MKGYVLVQTQSPHDGIARQLRPFPGSSSRRTLIVPIHPTDRRVVNVLRVRAERLARDEDLDALLLRDAADALKVPLPNR